nr:hypothetical protein [Alkalilacustris brevis]
MRKMAGILGVVGLLGLAACGENIGQQAILGGGTGAVAGAVVGGDPITGAAVGAAGNVAFCQLYPERCR